MVNYLGELEQQLGNRYRTRPEYFKLEEGVIVADQEEIRERIFRFFSNDLVYRALSYAKEKGAFSRSGNESPSRLYADAIQKLVEMVEYRFGAKTDFSPLQGFAAMDVRLRGYIREKKTPATRKILKFWKRAIDKNHPDLVDAKVLPLVIGSVIYGDAAESSDLDVVFACLPGDKDKQYDLIDKMDTDLHVTKEKALIKDMDGAVEERFSLANFNRFLLDIINQKPCCIGDYAAEEVFGREFYPYNWLWEGQLLADKDFGEAGVKMGVTRRRVQEAVAADPFFELVMCTGMLATLEKRIAHLGRR